MNSNRKKRRDDEELRSKTELLHELQVQHIELEMQNRQLREAQQQLEETRDRYANLYDYAPVGYMTLDEHGVVLEINLTGAGLLGMERFNIVGQPFASRLSSSGIKTFSEHLRQTFSQTDNCVSEVQIKARDGMPRILNLESVADSGNTRTCRTVMRDLTAQRKISLALQLSRSAQEALLQAIPALVFYLDANLRFTHVSQVFADFVGQAPEHVFGKSIHDLLPAAIAHDFQRMAASVLHSGTALYGFENNLQDANGNMIYFSTVFAPFRDVEGNIIGLAGVSIDITNIKGAANLNSDLLVQNRRLTHNLFTAQEEERRNLARELHDELGQWFTAIQAEAQIICNVAKHSPEIHLSALAISNSASKVHELIRGMLRHLRPSLLDELGLAESIREMVRQWCVIHHEIECELKLETSMNILGQVLY